MTQWRSTSPSQRPVFQGVAQFLPQADEPRATTLAEGGAAPAEPNQPRWQQSLRQAIRDPAELCRLLQLPPRWADEAQRAAQTFGLFVTREYLSRVQPGNPFDPLLRQVLPLEAELVSLPEVQSPEAHSPEYRFSADQLGPPQDSPLGAPGTDPVGDLAAQVAPGLLHKYAGRALMVATGTCAVHCRYCFRRHYPYETTPRGLAQWEPALAHLAADPTIDELILSGGDPLVLADGVLSQLVERLASIGHLRRLRVHTRLPIVLPSRVTDELLAWLTGTRLTSIVVVHANHPAEIDPAVARALGRLIDAGLVVLNQAVLLAGVNDDETALLELSRRLIDLRVMPYYLHQLDRVAGAAHFEVPESRGKYLIERLRQRLPGYAVPRYVRETAGEPAKVPIG